MTQKCIANQSYLKSMIDKGAIRDSSYYPLSKLLRPDADTKEALAALAVYRRKLSINADNLNARMNSIADLIKRNNPYCLATTIMLYDNLIKYIKDVSYPGHEEYLAKFLPKNKVFHVN
jgi:hypothetical protein